MPKNKASILKFKNTNSNVNNPENIKDKNIMQTKSAKLAIINLPINVKPFLIFFFIVSRFSTNFFVIFN